MNRSGCIPHAAASPNSALAVTFRITDRSRPLFHPRNLPMTLRLLSALALFTGASLVQAADSIPLPHENSDIAAARWA